MLSGGSTGMRTQFCRTVTPDKLRACGASERVIKELEEVGFLCEEHPALAQTGTKPIKTLMQIPDPEIKAKVISSVEKSLESGKDPVTGEFTKKKAITETQVKQVIAKIAPETKTIAQSPTVTPEDRSTHTHVPEEKVIQTYNPPSPIERSDKDDHANGVVKRDWNSGNDIPDRIDIRLRDRTKAIMRQMVRYGKALDTYQAIDLIIEEGVAKWEDVCEEACLQESAEA
jgi:hypothetical protein